jgi:flagellar biosynthesis/type III secretory pathway protein FliH
MAALAKGGDALYSKGKSKGMKKGMTEGMEMGMREGEMTASQKIAKRKDEAAKRARGMV